MNKFEQNNPHYDVTDKNTGKTIDDLTRIPPIEGDTIDDPKWNAKKFYGLLSLVCIAIHNYSVWARVLFFADYSAAEYTLHMMNKWYSYESQSYCMLILTMFFIYKFYNYQVDAFLTRGMRIVLEQVRDTTVSGLVRD